MEEYTMSSSTLECLLPTLDCIPFQLLHHGSSIIARPTRGQSSSSQSSTWNLRLVPAKGREPVSLGGGRSGGR